MDTQPRPRRKTWLWFFAILGGLAIAAIIIPFIVGPVHGLQPVTPEDIKTARQLWERLGPRDYDMEYRKEGSVKGTFDVQVRNGKAVSVTMDGQPLPPEQFHYHTIPALMDDLETFVDLAGKPGNPPVYLRARFDPQDGQLIRYIYAVPGTAQQIKVSVRLRRPENASPTP
jgi:hypothetical protein